MATHTPFSEKSVTVTVRYGVGVGLKILPQLNKQNSACIVLTIFLQARHTDLPSNTINITLFNHDYIQIHPSRGIGIRRIHIFYGR